MKIQKTFNTSILSFRYRYHQNMRFNCSSSKKMSCSITSRKKGRVGLSLYKEMFILQLFNDRE